MPHWITRDTEAMDRILLWAVQLQGQWRSISTELSPDRHIGWPPLPSQRSWGWSTIIEEREVSWSRRHPSRTGRSRWRGSNHCSHDNLQHDLADRWMSNPMDPVLSHHTYQERQPATRSTTEQIFNLRILCEKYLQHQQEIFLTYFKASYWQCL